MFDKLTNTTDLTDIMFSCITGADRFTNMEWFNKLTNTTGVTDITFCCITG